MGYYEFNDHFWSPNEACKQKSEEERLSIIDKLYLWFRSLRHSNIESSESDNAHNVWGDDSAEL